MEEFLAKLKSFIPSEVLEWAAGVEPEYWAAGGGGLLLLILASGLNRRAKKRRFRKLSPKLSLEAFKISPMGRDAYLKINNQGEKATLTTITVSGRSDVIIKNALAGHQIDKGKAYSILLETAGANKLDSNFSIELRYMDTRNNVFRQTFVLSQNQAKPAKLVRD